MTGQLDEASPHVEETRRRQPVPLRKSAPADVTRFRKTPRSRAAGALHSSPQARSQRRATRRVAVEEATASTRSAEAKRRARTAQSFWTVAVAAPAVISVLRLVVAAGGEVQTTLLLVANVNPINLVAAFVTNSTGTVSAFLVLLFAIGAIVNTSMGTPITAGDREARPLVARWADVAPLWFQILVIVVALATWQVLYLPLLLLAVVVMFQLSPSNLTERRRRPVAVGLCLAYGALTLPTVVMATFQLEMLVVALLVIPAVLVLVITGPVHPVAIRPLATLGPLIMTLALIWTAISVVTTPFLPLNVTTVVMDQQPADATDGPRNPVDPTPATTGTPPPATAGDPAAGRSPVAPTPPAPPQQTTGPATEDLRGHVIQVDDAHAAILQEDGGVRYVSVHDIRARVLCPSDDDLPRYRLHVYGFHVEDSLLQGLGRRERRATVIAPACRATS